MWFIWSAEVLLVTTLQNGPGSGTSMKKAAMCAMVLVACLVVSGRCYAASTSFVLKWGSSGSGPGQFSTPQGIAVGQGDEVFVADTDNNRIEVFDSNGVFAREWSSAGGHPKGIACSSNGEVYVVEPGFTGADSPRVQVYSGSGARLRRWSGLGSANGEFASPFGVALDEGGFVYVSDSGNNRIQKFTVDGTWVKTWGVFGGLPGQFFGPSGLALGLQGHLYTSDASQRVQEFAPDSAFVRQWGTQGSGNGQFFGVRGMGIDADGNVYVCDASTNNRVQVFTSSGAYLTQFGGTGAADGQFQQPFGVAINSAGDVFVLDSSNNRVQKFGAAVVPTVKMTWGGLKARFR